MNKKILIGLIVIFSLFLTLTTFKYPFYAKVEVKKVREPAAAGKFYPVENLREVVSSYLEKAEYENYGRLRGLVVPHAGYIFSGMVAAQGFKEIPLGIRTVIILGPSHHLYFKGASISNYTHYKTPLGEVRISEKVNQLKEESLIVSVDDRLEHSIEVEIPFLQVVLKDFEIIPIMVGDVNPKELADILLKYIDDNTLVVASSDLSHYYPYEVANELDKYCTEAIPDLDFSKMNYCQACGKIPILTLMYIAKKKGWYGYLLEYKNSGDTAGDKERVVGYASIGFYEGVNKENQKILLKLARNTLESYLKNRTLPQIDISSIPSTLKEKRGCFVTLHKKGELRGCIGSLLPQEELYKCVMRNAINAALRDLRFKPVSYDELKDIDIEVSVLTLPKILEFKTPEELLDKISKKDGIILKSGIHQATYLPQVWEQIPHKELFLSHLCLKAGLPFECWKSLDIEIKTYQAQVFSEKDFNLLISSS